jgi:hypothetical protein
VARSYGVYNVAGVFEVIGEPVCVHEEERCCPWGTCLRAR